MTIKDVCLHGTNILNTREGLQYLIGYAKAICDDSEHLANKMLVDDVLDDLEVISKSA